MSHENQPVPGTPESHWGSHEPELQPARDKVLGLKRLIIETQTRLGPDATPEMIADDLQGRGIAVEPEEVVQCCSESY